MKAKRLHANIVGLHSLRKETFIKSVHEGQKFPCPHCEHKATQKEGLLSHITATHKDERFPMVRSSLKNSEFPIEDDGPKSYDKDISDNEDDLISDDEVENQNNSVKDKYVKDDCYLCPISSCTYSLRNGDRDLQRQHFVSSHSTMDNIDHLHFLRL